MSKYIFILLACFAPLVCAAQKERSDVRQGNKLYEKGQFEDSEKNYAEALKKNPASVQAAFNLGGAIYKQERWQEASAAYAELSKAAGAENPAVFYNWGNAELKQRQLDQAIESYKQSLRLNPNDKETKFNLAYAQKLKQEDENKGGGGGQNQDQQDEKKDEQKQDQQQQDQKQDEKKDEQKQDQQSQPKPEEHQDAERMLKAIQAAEDKTKEKLDAQKVEAQSRRSGKDW